MTAEETTNKRTLDGSVREVLVRLEGVPDSPHNRELKARGQAHLRRLEERRTEAPDPRTRRALISEVMRYVCEVAALIDSAEEAATSTRRPVDGDRLSYPESQPASNPRPTPSRDAIASRESSVPARDSWIDAGVASSDVGPASLRPTDLHQRGRPRIVESYRQTWSQWPGAHGVHVKPLAREPAVTVTARLTTRARVPATDDASTIVEQWWVTEGTLRVGGTICRAGDVALIDPRRHEVEAVDNAIVMVVGAERFFP